MTEPRAVFFLSTGRCGTQSVAHILEQSCGSRAVVEHEPIGFEYHPNRFLCCDPDKYATENNPAIQRHLQEIRSILTDKTYIEAGWPCYAHIPFFIAELKERVSIVHLVRHPVNVAASLVTHDFYKPENRNGFNLHGTLDPFNQSGFMQGYESRWNDMSRFEKCLYHWAVINRYGLWLQQNFTETPFLRIKAEDLFARPMEVYTQLLDFIGLSGRCRLDNDNQRVDNYSRKTRDDIDPELITRHPEIIELMDQFGYSESTPGKDSMRRYKKENRLRRWLKKLASQ